MARIEALEKVELSRPSLHTKVSATCSVLEAEGIRLVQIDTYGSEQRQMPGKQSQSIQLDRTSGAQLYRLLKEAFAFD